MALVFADEYTRYADRFDMSGLYSNVTTGVVLASGGRSNRQCLKIPHGSSFFVDEAKVEIGSNEATVTCGMLLQANALTSQVQIRPWIGLFDGPNMQVGLCFGNAGAIYAVRGLGINVLGNSSNGVIADDTLYYIELTTTFAASGTVQVWVDDGTSTTQVLNLSGVDTTDSANDYANVLKFANNDGSSSNFTFIDDPYLRTDSTRLGRRLNDWLAMTGDGNYSNWTPSAGSNYQCIDDAAPDRSTTFNSTSSASVSDSYTKDAIADISDITALIPMVFAEKQGTNSASIQAGVRIGSTDYNGSSQTLIDGSHQWYVNILEDDPSTSNPFSVSGIDAAELLVT